jgi:hypothetical protein
MFTSAKEFQDYAADCIQWARQAESESERNTCMEMAAAALRASTAADFAAALRVVPLEPSPTRLIESVANLIRA